MRGKSINFGDKKIDKSNAYKNKKIFMTDDTDVNKILVSKNNHMVQKIHMEIKQIQIFKVKKYQQKMHHISVYH